MNVTKEQLVGKPREIGKYKDMVVMENTTKGGLHFIYAIKPSGGTQTLGAGSHRAIARRTAMLENPEVEITELSKSEDLPKWLVDQLIKSEGAIETTRMLRSIEIELEKAE